MTIQIEKGDTFSAGRTWRRYCDGPCQKVRDVTEYRLSTRRVMGGELESFEACNTCGHVSNHTVITRRDDPGFTPAPDFDSEWVESFVIDGWQDNAGVTQYEARELEAFDEDGIPDPVAAVGNGDTPEEAIMALCRGLLMEAEDQG